MRKGKNRIERLIRVYFYHPGTSLPPPAERIYFALPSAPYQLSTQAYSSLQVKTISRITIIGSLNEPNITSTSVCHRVKDELAWLQMWKSLNQHKLLGVVERLSLNESFHRLKAFWLLTRCRRRTWLTLMISIVPINHFYLHDSCRYVLWRHEKDDRKFPWCIGTSR